MYYLCIMNLTVKLNMIDYLIIDDAKQSNEHNHEKFTIAVVCRC